jgi:hypothetical protein
MSAQVDGHCRDDFYEAGVTPSEIYDIDRLKAMRLGQDASNNVDTTAIQKCRPFVNIIPDMSSLAPA